MTSIASATPSRAVGTGFFEGKVAFVTGGSRGIGAAVVRRLAKDGAAVAFTYASNEAAATEPGPRGITVNNVQPGPVDTDLNPADGPMAATLLGLMALPRHGHADEVAGMVAYLAGPDGGYVTGASLTIDGGFGA